MLPVLRGVRIVEQGTFITGPCTGMMLADLGADVIKIESPGGDPYRAYQSGQFSPHFQAYNRNKRSIALDLRAEADHAVFRALIREADVYIQNFRPGAAERLGAGPQHLHELNPRLVYCSISGFGASGPYAERPSYDSVAQALSGFLSVVVDPERPRFMGPALADAISTLGHRVAAPINDAFVAGCGPRSRTLKCARSGPPRRLRLADRHRRDRLRLAIRTPGIGSPFAT